MQGINHVVIGGNLGDKPLVRYTPAGTAVTNFDIAVNRKWSDSEGNEKESTVWVRINAWGKQAENIGEYLDKGSPVLVQGELVENRWEDKETGKMRSKLEVRARSVTFLGSKSGSNREVPPSLESDDDIPF
ncbi:MAG: single-stranded DNA-binding protein [Thermodesulfobacteriota bacterium]